MEAIGIAASFIAIGQALLAGRHVSKDAFARIESLRAAVEAANTQGMIFHDNEIEGPDLRLARGQITDIANRLDKVRQKCTQVGQNGKIKPKMARWFWMQKELQQCRDKARDARSALQLALATLTFKGTVQMSLHIERLTLRSASHHDLGSASDSETDASEGDDALSSASTCGNGFRNEEDCAIPGQVYMDSFRELRSSLRSVRVVPNNDETLLAIELHNKEAVWGSMLAYGRLLPDDRDAVGNNIMSSAILRATEETLEFLMELWSEHLRKDTYHPDWLFTANRELRRPDLSSRRAMAIRLIASYGEDVVDASQTELHEAVDRDENTTTTHDLQGLITKYPWTVDQWNHEGHTPLTVASKNGNLYAVRELIRLGCNIDQPDYEGNTPLFQASARGHTDLVHYLLDAGCSVNATSTFGETALHFASDPYIEPAEDPGAIVKILLSAGASAKASCLRGFTPLHDMGSSTLHGVKVTRRAAMTTIRLLLEAGADINAMNNQKERPLDRAIFGNQPEVMKCLIEAGAQITKLRGKRNLLHLAAREARFEALQYLMELPLPVLYVDQEDDWHHTPWDCFSKVLHVPIWSLDSCRRPMFQEENAFVALYKKLRDQSLELDISRLQRIRQHLEDGIYHGAIAILQSLISEKRDWEQWGSLRTYEAISLQIRERMIDAALESVGENIEVLKEKVEASPWDQVSHWDPSETEDSDDLEEYTESEWTETEDDAGGELNESENNIEEPASDDD
ncbi:Ankyrin repeat and protein kinase domain-containing protein 1 [Colletotrichum fructicola Nara gc5]|uniref:Ankyrin repeat and protein kinase domain-containing protein 1 n=1 Tax=Colletotrichum fructicola (strain Nara gc5) TaxID=1213859 RepID=A0A7J6IK10_COLFN|nr:Ankyrin repeat and protein kinase domain-containing protein 1 [Colletotrichum fructicola Nara gc5]